MVGQNITQLDSGQVRVQTGRSSGSFVDLNQNQFQEFQSRLRSSQEAGKLKPQVGTDSRIVRAINFGFSEARSRGFQQAVERLERQKLQTIGKQDRAKISRDLRLSQTQLRQLQATDRGDVQRVRTLPPRQQQLKGSARLQALERGKGLATFDVRDTPVPRTATSIGTLRDRDKGTDVLPVVTAVFNRTAQDAFKAFFLPKDQKAIKDFASKTQVKGDEINLKLENAKRIILESLIPTQKVERLKNERIFGSIENQQDRLNKDITNFNNNFGGDKNLTQAQINQASIQAKTLSQRQGILDAKAEAFTTFAENQKKAKGSTDSTVILESVLGSIATAPLSLTQSAIASLTRPIKTTKGFVAGVKTLPSQLKEQPFAVGGTLAGEFIGSAIAFSVLQGIFSTASLTKAPNKFVFEKSVGKIKTPLSKTFPQEFKFVVNENQIKSFLRNEIRNRGGNFNKLPKIDQDFMVGQVKAKIRNNPELFIPEIRKRALARLGIRKKGDLRKIALERLEGKFNQTFVFSKGSSAKRLSSLQEATLRRVGETLKKERISKALKVGLDKKLLTTSEIFGKKRLDLLKARIRIRLQSNPKIVLTSIQKKALSRAKNQFELNRIASAIRKGSSKVTKSDLLGVTDKAFIKSQFKAQARSQPERFIGGTRRQALVQLQKQKIIPKIKSAPSFTLIANPQLTEVQKILLGKLKNTQQLKSKPKIKVTQVSKPFQLTKTKVKTKLLSGSLGSAITGVKPLDVGISQTFGGLNTKQLVLVENQMFSVQKQLQMEGLKVQQQFRLKLKVISGIKNKLASVQQQQKQSVGLAQPQLIQQRQKLNQKLKEQQKFLSVLQSQAVSMAQAVNVAQLERARLRSRQKLRQKFVQKQLKLKGFILPKKKSKAKKQKIIKKKTGQFDTFVFKNKKPKKIGSFNKPSNARKELKRRLSNTLRASGFVLNKKTNQRLKPKITSGFRLSKIKKNVLVELQNRRLDNKQGEVKRIQQLRKTKSLKIIKNKLDSKKKKFKF